MTIQTMQRYKRTFSKVSCMLPLSEHLEAYQPQQREQIATEPALQVGHPLSLAKQCGIAEELHVSLHPIASKYQVRENGALLDQWVSASHRPLVRF